MSTKSREHLYGTTIRMSAERAKQARQKADRLACEASNFGCSAIRDRRSSHLGDALNAGFLYLVRCLGCDTHHTAVLDIVRDGFHIPPFLQRFVERHGSRRPASALVLPQWEPSS